MDAVAERVEQTEQATRPTEVATKSTPVKMFNFSEYLDIGPGAEECEHKRDGACEDPEHFHAWCRLPNKFQQADIRDKGLAAKARRIRALKDPESDSHAILEGDLAEIHDEIYLDTMIDELLAADWASDYSEALRAVEEREEFEHIEQHREEFNRLEPLNSHLPTEEQSEEWRTVDKIIRAYLDAVKAEVEGIQTPKRARFHERGIDAVIDLVRSQRIASEGDSAFLNVYGAWMWFVGTFQVKPHEVTKRPYLPMWTEIGDPTQYTPGAMYAEAPEVIAALKETFDGLSLAHQGGRPGN